MRDVRLVVFDGRQALHEIHMRQKAVLFFEPVNHVYKVMLAAADMGYAVIVMHQMKLFAPKPYERSLDRIAVDIQVDDWFEEATLLELVARHTTDFDLQGTYTGAEIALPFEARLREQLGLPGHPPVGIGELLDKYTVRSRLGAAGLTALACYDRDGIAGLEQWPFAGAGIFKPRNGGASALVTKCRSMDDVARCVEAWKDKSEVTNPLLRKYIEGNDEYFLEACAEGELMSVESLVCRGEVITLGILSRTVLERDPTIEMGACFPRRHPLQDRIYDKVAAIHRELDVRHGATHMEIMVSPSGDIELIELNLRFAGADSLEIISMAYQRNIAEELVLLCCGERPRLDDAMPQRVASMQYLLAPDTLRRFDSMGVPEGTDFVRVHVPDGAELGANRNQIDWVGCFIVESGSYDEVIQRIRHVRSNLRMNDEPIGNDANNRVLIS